MTNVWWTQHRNHFDYAYDTTQNATTNCAEPLLAPHWVHEQHERKRERGMVVSRPFNGFDCPWEDQSGNVVSLKEAQ